MVVRSLWESQSRDAWQPKKTNNLIHVFTQTRTRENQLCASVRRLGGDLQSSALQERIDAFRSASCQRSISFVRADPR